MFPFFDQFDLETWESCVNYKTLPETLQIKIFKINFFGMNSFEIVYWTYFFLWQNFPILVTGVLFSLITINYYFYIFGFFQIKKFKEKVF